VTDTGTLERAINEEEVGSAVDMDDVQSSAEAETDEFADNTGDGDSSADGCRSNPDHPSRDVCHPPVASHHRPDVFRAVTAFSLLDRQPVTDRNSQPEYEQARSHHRNRRQSATESEHSESKRSRESVSRARQSVRRGIESGLPAGIGGG